MNYGLEPNFSNICRICLTENSTMKSIFNCEQILEQEIMLCDMLMSCASVSVLRGDGLPENICINCSQQINTAYLFRKLCERSDTTLRNCTTITTLSSNQDNIFTTEMESSKVILRVDKSSHLETKNEFIGTKNIEYDNFKTLTDTKLIIESIDNQQVKSSDTDFDETITETDNLNFSLDTVSSDIIKIQGNGRFRCEYCGKRFNAKSFLARHVSVHKNNSAQPNTQEKKNYIVRKHNQPRTCEICNKTFRFHSNLKRHKLIHTGEKPFLCNVCGKGFAQMAYLKIHSFIHTGEKPYKCQMCERSFAAPGTLMTHVRTHTGERPHICRICGKDFPQSGYLSAHIRTHTGEKPIECKVCHRRFNQSGRLIVHMRIHSGEKPYQCTSCDRRFAVKSTLKKHIRTHTGEKPYPCKMCGQAFAQSGTLTTHMKVHKLKPDKSIPWT